MRVGLLIVREGVLNVQNPHVAMSDATILATIAACKGGACAGQIERAAAAPHFFNFAAVCRLESVRELGEAHPAAALARLLAYGTLADALALPPGALPASFAPGAPAFRKAQVVSLQAAALSSRSLSYDAARAATGARGDAELEALVLEAAYAGLLDARLDQRERRVAVAAAAGRGVPPGDATALDALARDLARWRAGIGGALDAVARTADAVAAGARAEGAWAAHVARAVDAAAVAAARAAAEAASAEQATVTIEERVSVSLSRDGGLNSMEVKGVLSLLLADEAAGRLRIVLARGDDRAFTYQHHPNINKAAFADGVLALKAADRAFPAGAPTGLLRWRFAAKDDDAGAAPLMITAWPEEGAGGTMAVNVEFALQRKELRLTDVIITLPLGGGDVPAVAACDGAYKHNARDNTLSWRIDEVDANNA